VSGEAMASGFGPRAPRVHPPYSVQYLTFKIKNEILKKKNFSSSRHPLSYIVKKMFDIIPAFVEI
jgi:hypothetical protein